ncbi:MAG: hypothetical protein ABJG86_11190 [Nitratireductor sp.]
MRDLPGEGENDRRKVLRAHWPPRLRNTVSVELPDWLYAQLYLSAKAEGWSLGDELRHRLRASLITEAERP